jgi:hypothetical protein
VRRDEEGKWVASWYRPHAVTRRCAFQAIATVSPRFATRQEAQRIADVHKDEGFANPVSINDGYSWQVDPGVDEYLADRGRNRTRNGAAVAD